MLSTTPGGAPIGGAAAAFGAGGAPIGALGGVFAGGFPLGGLVSLFRSGAPVPNVLFLSTLTSAGPIGEFFIGLSGSPIGFLAIPLDNGNFSTATRRLSRATPICLSPVIE